MRSRLAILFILLCPAWAQAAVDCADANAVAETYGTSGNPTTTSYTRPSGSDFVGFVIAGHQRGGGATTLDAMTWGGLNMTPTTTLQYVDPIWGQLFSFIGPPSGAQNIVMDWGATPLTDTVVIFVCTGVDQVTPLHDSIQSTGTGTNASTTVSNVASTDVVIACVTKDDVETMTGGGSLVAIATDNASPTEMNTGCWYQSGSAGGSVSVTWSVSQQWTIHAAAVKQVSPDNAGGQALWFP